MENFFKVYS